MPTEQQKQEARARMANTVNAEHNMRVMEGKINHNDGLVPVDGVDLSAINMGGSGTPTPQDIQRAELQNPQNLQVTLPGPTPGIPVPAPQAQPPAQPPVGGEPTEGQGQSDLIFNKYVDMTEAEKGHYHLQTTLTATQRENVRLQSQIEALQGVGPTPTIPGPSPGSRERVNPVAPPEVQWGESPAVQRAAEETGIDARVFADFAENIAKQATVGVNAQIGEIQAQLQAQQADTQANAYMNANHPEAMNHAPELSNFVAANPHIGDAAKRMAANGDAAQAYEYIWGMYQLNSGVGLQSRMQANAVVAEEEKNAARSAANLPSSPSTPVHQATQNTNEPSQEQVAAWLQAYRGGNAEAGRLWRRATMAPDLLKQGFEPEGFGIPRHLLR